jgi:hypothetical protein
MKLNLYPFYFQNQYAQSNSQYGRDDNSTVIIDAEERERELTIIALEERVASLELKLAGALSDRRDDYAEMKGLESDIDELYRHVLKIGN